MDSLQHVPGSEAAPAAGSALNPIAVRDIVALGVRVEWPEAVAVVGELCAFLETAESTTWVPDAEDVLITGHGTVLVRRGGAGTHDVDDLGRLLHSMLDPAGTPMPIRLFLTQSIGFGKYTTVRAYAEALAYYERPGRAELIQSLYQRCLETPPDAVVALPEVEDEEPPPPEPPRPRRTHRGAIAVALVSALLATAAVWLWSGDSAASASLAAFTDAVRSAAVVAVERAGWEAEASNEPVERTDADAAAAQRPAARSRGARPAPSPARAPERTSGPPLLTGPPRIPIGTAPPIEGGFARAPAAPPAGSPGAAPPAPDPTVYSTGSQGVEPPVMYYPQLPPVVPAGTDPKRLNTMELVVDETGAVQVAKLVSKPVRLPDMNMLSAAKTWKFHPATKDGRPVKYRLTVSWTVTPP